MQTKYPSNIRNGYAYAAFSFFGITGLWVMYLQSQGLTLVQIGLCESIFHVASFLFEVPSGVLADRFSYKTVLIAGRIAAVISAILMLVGQSFWWFALSFVFNALSYNLQSGTIDALLYDSLIATQQTDHYPNVASHLEITIELADTLGVVIAGFFVHWHFASTYGIAIVVACLGLGSVLLMREPHVTNSEGQAAHEKPQTIITIAKTAYQVLKSNSQLRTLMIFDALFSAVGTSYYFYFQSVMSRDHFSSWWISALMIISAALNIIGLQMTPTIQKRLTKTTLVRGLSWMLIVLLLASYFNFLPSLVLLFLAIQLLISLITPIFNSYYNDLIDSAQRATLLSVASVLFSVAMIAIFPLVGWLIDQTTFSLAFSLLGILMGLGLLLTRWHSGLHHRKSH